MANGTVIIKVEIIGEQDAAVLELSEWITKEARRRFTGSDGVLGITTELEQW